MTHLTNQTSPRPRASHAGHGGHGWMMIACCIPMLVIAIALVATGVASPAFILFAVMCTVMMALMMSSMRGGSDQERYE